MDGDEIDAIFYDQSARIKLKVKDQVCSFLQYLRFWSYVGFNLVSGSVEFVILFWVGGEGGLMIMF